jgi:hypothetical protein
MIHRCASDIVEHVNVGEGSQKGKTKPRSNPGFGPAGDEEFDCRYLVNISSEK